ncbi:hypothetical protein B0I37DRAFT_306966 [Chaetomium sp. MPI-CAGE-AT-0009]|nr:hypothetical protein B0I37DRAFT_306966 [Chaetomium sp. MPI-CAGE-AT-0009]
MPLSRSALERRNPPPRRKSCAACIRAKRRCNLAQPTCSRCSHRMVQCVYPSGQVDRTTHGRPAAEVISAEARSSSVAEQTCPPSFDLLSRADFDFDTGTLDFLLDTPNTPNHLGRSPLASGSTIDERNALDNLFPSFALSPTMPFYQPMFPKPGSPTFYVTYQRLQYALEHLMNAPKQMAHENALPWCHAQLYRDAMPRAMQDAQACGALYAARNPANAAAVRRTIEGRVANLLASLPSPVPESGTPTTEVSPLETLARAHALILYQSMRLFDGDVAARAAAKHTMPYLDTAAEALAPVAAEEVPGPLANGSNDEDGRLPLLLPVYPLAGTRAFWEGWIVRESARRTLLLMKVLWLLYRLLRCGAPIVCDKNVASQLRFTASAHLWQAGDAVEFALAWGQRKHYVVSNLGLVDILAEAESSDIDQYGRILLTAMLGVDEVKGWFTSKGGVL